jgi:hypothetical protein
MSQIINEEIGRVAGTPDVKTEMGYVNGPFGSRIPFPRVYTRDVTHIFTVTISVPDNGNFTSVIKESVAAGLVAGTVAAFLANPATAIPAFKTAFWATLVANVGTKINEFDWIGINDREERGDWKPV